MNSSGTLFPMLASKVEKKKKKKRRTKTRREVTLFLIPYVSARQVPL